MESQFVKNLYKHIDLLESIFQKDKNVIETVLSNIDNTGICEEDIISHFFIELQIPLHFMNYKIIDAIGNRSKK